LNMQKWRKNVETKSQAEKSSKLVSNFVSSMKICLSKL
jgi:hypothetical protein